ncbi:DUF3566 domain-containing protein [Pseudonocardia phyllosphaerae]|uniref:DUF3566 domain-containing protein n=1 Tax=Pseudonocardia phyllosphaerae TaxID=3390502 RepID=UPI00397809BD
MSTDDRTPSTDEGRTVATEAEQAGGPAAGTSEPRDPSGRPSPVPRNGAAPPPEEHPDQQQGGGASPPPWRRVPDRHGDGGDHHPTVADSLLSDAPTAFLDGPDRSGGKAGAAAGAAGGAAAGAGGAAAARDRDDRSSGRDSGKDSPRASVRNRPPRQALLQLKRLDPWSVLKMALALSVVLLLVWMVAAGVLYGVLGGMGVWDRLNGTYADLVTGQQEMGGSLISAGRVFLLAFVVGLINSLLFAVAMTIMAFVYNVTADLVGGVEVTLSERD